MRYSGRNLYFLHRYYFYERNDRSASRPAPTKELVQQILDIVDAYPSVLGIHDLLVHDYGPGHLIISLHVEVSASGDILMIHDEIDNIERELKQRLNCTATIHMDPIVTDDAFSNQMKDTVSELVQN